jgi:opacity protein-like surface antigen
MTTRPFTLVLLALLSAALLSGPAQAAEKEPLGGEFTLILGGNTGPFGTDPDFSLAGSLGVPLLRTDPLFGQALLGEIMIGYSKTEGSVRSTSPLTAVGAPVAAVTNTTLEITTLQVLVGFKYRIESLGRLQPFVSAGAGFNVFLCQTKGATLGGGDFVCGIAPIPAELRARDVPRGEGTVRASASFGTGLDYLLTDRLFVGAEVRHNVVTGDNDDFTTYGARIGFRW